MAPSHSLMPVSDRKYEGYFCLAMSCSYLCLDLNKSKPASGNSRCYKLTPDLRPIAGRRRVYIRGAKPVKIKGETYFVGGKYIFRGTGTNSTWVNPRLCRLSLQSRGERGTDLDRKDLCLEPVDCPPSLKGLKEDYNPIVEEIGNKFYILDTGGGVDCPLFQVLDPSTTTWSILPDPPFLGGDKCGYSECGYSCDSFIRGHSVIGKRLFVITKAYNRYCFDTEQGECGEWHRLPPYVPAPSGGRPNSAIGGILLWGGISCGTQCTFSIRVPKKEDKDDHHLYYLCFSQYFIDLVDSDGIVLAEQRNVFDAIFKGVAPLPYSRSFVSLEGMTFLPSPYKDTMCAAALTHDKADVCGGLGMPTLSISFFRPVINTSVVNSVLDGSYQDANNPDATDYRNVNFVDVQLDHGYVLEFSEHFDDMSDMGFQGPACFL